MQHAKWAVTDANVRSRATIQMFKFLEAEFWCQQKTNSRHSAWTASCPDSLRQRSKCTAKSSIRSFPLFSDVNEKIFEKVGETQDSVESLVSDHSDWIITNSPKNTGVGATIGPESNDSDAYAGWYPPNFIMND